MSDSHTRRWPRIARPAKALLAVAGLERLGLAFEQIGEEMDYHGTRALFYLPEHKYISALNPEVLELFHLLKQQLRPQLLLYPYLVKDKG